MTIGTLPSRSERRDPMRGPIAELETAAPTNFPATYATLSTERLREAFAAAPDRLETAVDGLAEADLQARPIPQKWSIHEILLHVTDSECLSAVRVRMALGDDRPRFPGYDEKRWALRLRYRDRSPAVRDAMVRLFRAQREATSELFAAATPEEWRHEGTHPDWGTVTLRQLLELYADHGERHLAQILERRRLLGRPLDLLLLLPDRLY
jgi:uncharacterized damage-inducible protein DinB